MGSPNPQILLVSPLITASIEFKVNKSFAFTPFKSITTDPPPCKIRCNFFGVVSSFCMTPPSYSPGFHVLNQSVIFCFRHPVHQIPWMRLSQKEQSGFLNHERKSGVVACQAMVERVWFVVFRRFWLTLITSAGTFLFGVLSLWWSGACQLGVGWSFKRQCRGGTGWPSKPRSLPSVVTKVLTCWLEISTYFACSGLAIGADACTCHPDQMFPGTLAVSVLLVCGSYFLRNTHVGLGVLVDRMPCRAVQYSGQNGHTSGQVLRKGNVLFFQMIFVQMQGPHGLRYMAGIL